MISIDLYELLELGDLSLNVLVGNGDVVNVPEAKRFHVIGFARDPGQLCPQEADDRARGHCHGPGDSRRLRPRRGIAW